MKKYHGSEEYTMRDIYHEDIYHEEYTRRELEALSWEMPAVQLYLITPLGCVSWTHLYKHKTRILNTDCYKNIVFFFGGTWKTSPALYLSCNLMFFQSS